MPLPSLYWIGGSPCAGKSAIARLLAAAHGMAAYHCDDAYEQHTARALPSAQPLLYRLPHLTWDEIWSRPHALQVAEELALYREEFPLILDDLCGHTAPTVLAEGSALLPECVCTVLDDPRRAVWIVPTESFQRAAYPRRGWVEGILQRCRDPQAAFAAWMDRDVAFARFVAEDALQRGLRVLWVDGSVTIAATTAIVAGHFGLTEGR